ncbi:MAG TPA: extensin family protein [Albidovulum sp.]|uniref:extensin-like domain-containing protein n=1 Tax=Albidovulum sp. TaxID=1872424 RepID=UPI002B861F6E|nr:extensin family protein [Albidovulum sp.]
MRGGAIALAALIAVLPVALAAKAPLTSPRPATRTDLAEKALESTGLPRLVVPAGLAMSALAKPVAQGLSLRPRPRPGALAEMAAVAQASEAMSIRPRLRPPAAARPAETTDVAAPALIDAAFTVRPMARPENLQRLSQVSAVAYVPGKVAGVLTSRKGSVCGDPAIKGTTIPPIISRVNGCGLEDGVEITSVAGVKLSVPVEIDCTTAKALKTWVEETAIPSVGKRGGGLSALQIAGSYACRPRNSQKGNKISEHGRGRAIDIGGYVLANGTAVSVLKGWGSDASGKVLASMRKEACGPFNTVLGPGSDSYHRDHLHFDTARGRGPYCR